MENYTKKKKPLLKIKQKKKKKKKKIIGNKKEVICLCVFAYEPRVMVQNHNGQNCNHQIQLNGHFH
jgi:hypothetical protein